MSSGIYAAYTGLLSRTQALDTAANNLANSNTTGFRAQREYFRGVLAATETLSGGMDSGSAAISQSVNRFGLLGGSTLDLSQGVLNATGNPLDLAVQGRGFFEIAVPGEGVQLTRDGSFARASDGTLTTQHGERVLDATGHPITIPTGAVHIGPDGTVSVSTDGGSAVAGRIGIVDFGANDLSPAGANRFTVRTGAKAIPTEGTVQQGSLEGANQDAIHATTQLLLIQRQAEMMQKAMNVFSNELDKTAAEELGRV